MIKQFEVRWEGELPAGLEPIDGVFECERVAWWRSTQC
jgi:hypothetical protein